MSQFFPCTKDCPDRYTACHDYCERFLEKKAEWDARKAQERMNNAINTYVCNEIYKNRYKGGGNYGIRAVDYDSG